MKSPKQIFFEWNRNTFRAKNELTDFVEKLYGNCENKFAPVYKRFTQNIDDREFNLTDLFHVIHYIGILHASLPVRDSEIEELIKNSKKEDFFLNIINTETGEVSVNADDSFEKFKSEPAFIQSVKIMKAIADFMKNETYLTTDNWKSYSSSGNGSFHLISDNPVILRDKDVKSIYDSELIFQLSKSTSIVHTKGKSIKAISGEDKVMTDMLIFLQSDKYVAGPDFNYLETIANLCIKKKYDKPEAVDYLKKKLFQLFD